MHPELDRLERFYLEVRAAVSAGQLAGPDGIARVTANTVRDANNFVWMVSAQTSTPDKASFVVVGVDGTLYPAEAHQFQPAQQAPAISAGPSWESAAAPTAGAYQPVIHEPAYQGPAYQGPAAMQQQPDTRPGGFQHQPQSQLDEPEETQKGFAAYVDQFKAFPLWLKILCGVVVAAGLFFVVTRFTGGGDETPVEDPTIVSTTIVPGNSVGDSGTDPSSVVVTTTVPLAPVTTLAPVETVAPAADPATTIAVAPVDPAAVPVETVAPPAG